MDRDTRIITKAKFNVSNFSAKLSLRKTLAARIIPTWPQRYIRDLWHAACLEFIKNDALCTSFRQKTTWKSAFLRIAAAKAGFLAGVQRLIRAQSYLERASS
jgi:hypothetical protein